MGVVYPYDGIIRVVSGDGMRVAMRLYIYNAALAHAMRDPWCRVFGVATQCLGMKRRLEVFGLSAPQR